MHTGQWRNSGLPDQKVLPFRRGVLSQQHKLGTMEQFGSKRSYRSGDPTGFGEDLLWGALFIAAGMSLAVGIPETVRSLRERSLWTRINKRIKKE
uniref:Uncharacterized protein n=1 Tax=Arundo donax TaxID=35708 RepID=A0A0A9GN44_ARUDO